MRSGAKKSAVPRGGGGGGPPRAPGKGGGGGGGYSNRNTKFLFIVENVKEEVKGTVLTLLFFKIYCILNLKWSRTTRG